MRRALNKIPLRFRSLFRRKAADTELDSELRFHVEKQIAANVAAGMSPAEARRAALREFGVVEQLKEECRDMRKVNWLQDLAQDLCFGLRMLRKSPGFTAVAILTLALGIGANTAIFSLVDWLILRPLSIAHPSQVVFLETSWKNGGIGTQFCYRDFRQLAEQTSDVFTGTSALQMFQMDGLSVDGKSQPMWSNYVAGNFFTLLGIKPSLGRFILPSEGKTIGADPVLVLGYSYWKSRFNADPEIIGKRVSVNGHPMTIVGVAPKNFQGLAALLDTQGYMPLAMAVTTQDAPQNFLTDERAVNLELIARLKDGVTLRQIQPVLATVAQRLSEQYRGQMTVRATPLGPASLVTGPAVRPALALVSALFLILAGAILALACVNIANLCLVRVSTRQREVTLRAALGATRSRLLRQLLTESLLLAALGCVGGIFLGIAASRSFGSISLHTAIPTVLDFHFDWRVFAYALAAAAFTGILVGITPAIRASRSDLSQVLRDGGRTSSSGRQRLRSALVVAQVAGSLMLLIVAGLFVRSLEKARHADLGFDPSHILNASFDPHEAGYEEAQTREFQATLLDRARVLPGVQSASLAMCVPMGYSNYSRNLKIDGYNVRPSELEPSAGFNAVSTQYFETMRIPLAKGRAFSDSDTQNSQRVAVINQNFADMYWHGQNPIGRHFSAKSDAAHPMEVVGVARNSRDTDIFTKNDPFYYVPLTQYYTSVTTLQLRSSLSPETLTREIFDLAHSLDPAIPVFDTQPMSTVLDGLNGFLLFKFAAVLAGAIGILGLILAVVGAYGVISYATAQRTHEIGIRMALGAQRAQILQMILRQGFVIVGIGVVAGVLAATAMARLVGSLLFGVTALDAVTYVSASLILTVVALLASYIPARRAMKVDPMVALRYE